MIKFSFNVKGIKICYEKSKSCLDGCDVYDKQLYGWYGTIQRQLQRSQYHMQYSRPVQVVFSIILLLCLLGELTNQLYFVYYDDHCLPSR